MMDGSVDQFFSAAAAWVKKVSGTKSCNFSTDTADFRQHFERQLQIFVELLKKILNVFEFFQNGSF